MTTAPAPAPAPESTSASAPAPAPEPASAPAPEPEPEGRLSIVATPIGNLGDITLRALEVLRTCDVVLAEDTRVTGKLLAANDIHVKLERCDDNVILDRAPGLVSRMLAGEHLAFCSDAGMPGVSDPGLVLVDAAREAGVAVDVLPGASAVPTALAAAGFPGTSAFYFGGFLPRKRGACKRLLLSLSRLEAALVFFESPHRLAASARTIADIFPAREVALCRELTKLHEEVLRLAAEDLADELESRESIKGEAVLVVAPPARGSVRMSSIEKVRVYENGPSRVDRASERASDMLIDDPELAVRIWEALEEGVPKSELVRKLAAETGLPRNDLYDLVHRLGRPPAGSSRRRRPEN